MRTASIGYVDCKENIPERLFKFVLAPTELVAYQCYEIYSNWSNWIVIIYE